MIKNIKTKLSWCLIIACAGKTPSIKIKEARECKKTYNIIHVSSFQWVDQCFLRLPNTNQATCFNQALWVPVNSTTKPTFLPNKVFAKYRRCTCRTRHNLYILILAFARFHSPNNVLKRERELKARTNEIKLLWLEGIENSHHNLLN